MRFGYVANAIRLNCKANHKFRLASYSDHRLADTITANLDCLATILRFNARHGLRLFRISSDLIPFASHPACTLNWRHRFQADLERLGAQIHAAKIRIAMHPGQFVILNSLDEGLLERSIAELRYHAELLDSMGLDTDAKIQIHVGGLYGQREKALERFTRNYGRLSGDIRKRLVIENDDHRYPLQDCLILNDRLGIPIVLDTLHHQCLNHGEPMRAALLSAFGTWGSQDGPPMLDYSTQQPGRRKGTHAATLETSLFRRFLADAQDLDFDIMFELRDKEASALKARSLRGTKRKKTPKLILRA